MSEAAEQLEIFGDDVQVQLQRRYYRLWQYLKVNPRLSFTGRSIGLDSPSRVDLAPLAGLARELGMLALAFTTTDLYGQMGELLTAQDLHLEPFHHLLSGAQCEAKCRDIMATRQLPPGYQIERITGDTPGETVRGFQILAQRCGVSPLPGYILRGRQLPAVAELVLDAHGSVAAVGAGLMRHHLDSPYGKLAHVGFLATDPEQRGQGLARLLLARIIAACFQECGAEGAHTGVRAENLASQRVCQDCGLEDSGTYFVAVIYPPVLKRDRFTS